MFRSMFRAAGLVPFALLPLACASAGDPVSDGQSPSGVETASADSLTTGASFQTTGGGKVDVYIESDGGLIVSIVGPGMSDETVAAYRAGKADLVDLYLGLTNQAEVPAEVEQMNALLVERRSQAANGESAQVDPAAAGVTPAAAPAGAQARIQSHAAVASLSGSQQAVAGPSRSVESLAPTSMTTAQFTTNYCGTSDWSFANCWTNVTDTGYHGQYCFWMNTTAYSIAGTITHRIDRHIWGKWRTQLSNYVPAGYLSVLERYANGLQDNMRGGVWDASGDIYHLTVYGLR